MPKMGAAQPIVGRHGIRLNVARTCWTMSALPDDEPRQATSRFQVRATAESHFSWLRTRMSTERTLMSWVRTATALIGFGFTIFQFLHRFNQTPGIKPAEYPWTPWVLGLGLIGTGIVGLTIA